MNKIVPSLALCFSILSIASCRFVSPSSQEVSELNTSGAYSNGAPAWAQLPKDQKTALPQNAGIVPQTFTVPESVSLSAGANASSSVTVEKGRGLEEDKKEIEKVDVNKKRTLNKPVPEVQETSVLGQLETQCPGTEEIAVNALKTEDIQIRIRTFLSLTKRCPRSADVWVWLARDYKSLNRFSESKRCVQAALALDPNHEGAKTLVKELGNTPVEE